MNIRTIKERKEEILIAKQNYEYHKLKTAYYATKIELLEEYIKELTSSNEEVEMSKAISEDGK